MLIVDAQVHLWGADTPERPWPRSPSGETLPAHQPVPVTKDTILPKMDEAGVDRVVIVPPNWDGKRNELALEAVRQHPDRFAIMGRMWLERPESRTGIVGWKKQPGMLGLRFSFNTEQERPWVTDGTADWPWPAAEREGTPLMLHVPGSVPAIDPIAARHPGLRLVIDHLAVPSGAKDAAAFAHLP